MERAGSEVLLEPSAIAVAATLEQNISFLKVCVQYDRTTITGTDMPDESFRASVLVARVSVVPLIPTMSGGSSS